MADVEYTLGVAADEQSVNRAKAAIQSIEKPAKGVETALKGISTEAKGAARDLSKIKSGKALDNEAKSAARLADELNRASREAQSYDDQRSQVAQRVGIAGDIDTSLATIGGGLDAAGLGDVGGSAIAVAEIAAVTEQLPLLAVSVKSLSSNALSGIKTVGGLATAAVPAIAGLGGLTVGIAAVTAVALPLVAAGLALGAAFNAARKDAEENAKAFETIFEVRSGLREDIAGGLTTGDAQARLEELNTQIQLTATNVNEAQGSLNEFNDNIRDNNALGEAAVAINRVVNPAEQARVDTLNEERDELDKLIAEQIELTAALERGTLAANDRALAERAATEALLQDVNELVELRRFENSLVGQSTEQLRDRRNALDQERQILREAIAEIEASGDTSEAATTAIEEYTNEIAILDQQTYAVTDAITAQTTALQTAEEALAAYTQGLLEEAELAGEQVRLQRELAALGTEGLQDRIQSINDERAAIEAQIAVLANASQQTDETRQRLSELNQELFNLGAEEIQINQDFLPDAAFDEAIGVQQQFVSDSTELSNDYYKTLADIERGYIDASIDAANKRADAEQAALDKLNDSLADIDAGRVEDATDALRDLSREQLETAIDFQRQEVDAARDNARRLVDIRRDAARAEEDALQNRDFAALFDIRRDTSRQIEDAQTQADREADDRRVALERRQQDQLTAFANEAQDRQIAYERQRADAQARYAEEIADANAAYAENLAALRDKFADEQATAQQAYNEQQAALQSNFETQLAQFETFGVSIQEVMAQAFDGVLNQATDLATALQGTEGASLQPTNQQAVISARRLGGSLAGGQVSAVGEAGVESFTVGNQTMTIPGAGLFQPFRGGYVNPANSGTSQTFNINASTSVPQQITGGNPEQIASVVMDRIERNMGGIIDKRFARLLQELSR